MAMRDITLVNLHLAAVRSNTRQQNLQIEQEITNLQTASQSSNNNVMNDIDEVDVTSSSTNGASEVNTNTDDVITQSNDDIPEATSPPNDNSNTNGNDVVSAESSDESNKDSDGEAPRLSPEDEIGVTLDYEFPEHVFHGNDSGPESRDSASHRRNRARRRRRRREVEQLNAIGARNTGHHWMWQFVSGIFTGLVFFAIGVVFVVHFTNLPTYIGVLFLLVSFPPCCMAINRWRYARMARNQQQQALERLNAIRRRHRSADEGSAHRRTTLPGPDLPPAYNNLGFEVEVTENQTVSRVSSYSAFGGIAPPTYDDAVKFKELMELELARERQQTSEDADNNSVFGEVPHSSQ